jgi:pSer/pThr/pTyr-binding forkhead associated (FHA) protein
VCVLTRLRQLKAVLDAERAGEPFLAYRDREGCLKLFVLGHDDRTVTVGRRNETALPIAWDGEVSCLHVELQRLGGEWTIADDGISTNGTFVGDRDRRRRGSHKRL